MSQITLEKWKKRKVIKRHKTYYKFENIEMSGFGEKSVFGEGSLRLPKNTQKSPFLLGWVAACGDGKSSL